MPLPREAPLPETLTAALFDLAAAIDLLGHASAGRLGVNQTDLICLHLLSRRGPMGVGDIAAALGLTTAAISAMAGRLEKAGYAHREIDVDDRRRVLLHASPAGAQQAFSVFDDLYRSATELIASYGESELETLADLLARFRRLIDEQTAALRRDR